MQELCGDVLLHCVKPGQQAREELFDLSPDWTYLNHGSYGATLRYTTPVESPDSLEAVSALSPQSVSVMCCRRATR